MAKYKTNLRLLHNGKTYKPGEEVILSERDAAPLLGLNAIEESASTPPKTTVTKSKAKPAPTPDPTKDDDTKANG